MSKGEFIVWKSVCFISTLFPCFPPDSGAPKRPRADVLYFRREQSPSIPKGFLEFFYLTKISYRERIMNHEWEPGTLWEPIISSSSYHPKRCLVPCGFHGKLSRKKRGIRFLQLLQEQGHVLWPEKPRPAPYPSELEAGVRPLLCPWLSFSFVNSSGNKRLYHLICPIERTTYDLCLQLGKYKDQVRCECTLVS